MSRESLAEKRELRWFKVVQIEPLRLNGHRLTIIRASSVYTVNLLSSLFLFLLFVTLSVLHYLFILFPYPFRLCHVFT